MAKGKKNKDKKSRKEIEIIAKDLAVRKMLRGSKKSKSAKDGIAKAKVSELVAAVADGKAAKSVVKGAPAPGVFEVALRAGDGFVLADVDPASTPGFIGDKAAGEALMAPLAEQVAELQERLYAEAKEGGKRAVLLIIQGMDTSGKGGIMRHVVGAADPQGIRITAFKAPTAEEKARPFLWRIRNALPTPGVIGVFDRSQYEDVLIGKVHELAPRATIGRRYAQINSFEKSVAASGTKIVKVMLHISDEEQQARLAERLANPEKYWKFNPGDLGERALWGEYMDAYQVAIDKCSTEVAPWYVVPADKKWYARLAVMNLLLAALLDLDPQWPAADFDVAEMQAKLEAMGDVTPDDPTDESSEGADES